MITERGADFLVSAHQHAHLRLDHAPSLRLLSVEVLKHQRANCAEQLDLRVVVRLLHAVQQQLGPVERSVRVGKEKLNRSSQRDDDSRRNKRRKRRVVRHGAKEGKQEGSESRDAGERRGNRRGLATAFCRGAASRRSSAALPSNDEADELLRHVERYLQSRQEQARKVGAPSALEQRRAAGEQVDLLEEEQIFLLPRELELPEPPAERRAARLPVR